MCMCAQSLLLCPTLCDSMEFSHPPLPTSSSTHGISQARILEWVAISSSRGSFQPKDWTHISWGSCIAGGFFTMSHQGSPTLNFPCATNSFRFPFTYSFKSPSTVLYPYENNVLFHYSTYYIILKFGKISWLLPILCIIHTHLQIIFHLTTSVQFSSVVKSCPTLWDSMNRSTPGLPVHHQLQSSLRLTSIQSVMPSNHLILCRPLLLLPPINPRIRVFYNESTLRMRWSKYWSFSFSIIPSKEIPGMISFRMDWLDHLAVQGTLKASPTPQFKSINSSALTFLHSPNLKSIHDHWKKHSLD